MYQAAQCATSESQKVSHVPGVLDEWEGGNYRLGMQRHAANYAFHVLASCMLWQEEEVNMCDVEYGV